MEKNAGIQVPARKTAADPLTPRQIYRTRLASLPFLLLIPLFWYYFPPLKITYNGPYCPEEKTATAATTTTSSEDFWTTIQPQSELEYLPCFEDFDCAILDLPMDWKNTSNPARLNLAVIRLPAQIPVTDSRYGGAIIVNPGGPGGSGVELVQARGHQLQEVVDSQDKFYDIVSFDPRGVGVTYPGIACFESPWHEEIFTDQFLASGIANSSNVAISQQYYLARAFGGACEPETADSIKYHLTTPYVASDMLALVEAHGVWRETKRHGQAPPSFDKTKEQLQYWGFSYGTLLGGTFVSLFPDRVGRVILDGVVDSEDYYSGNWSGNLVNTEDVVDAFFNLCADAGPDHCALARKDTKNGAQLRKKVETLLEHVKFNPVAITVPRAPRIITWSDIKSAIFQSLYSPETFPFLALYLDSILRHQALGSSAAPDIPSFPSNTAQIRRSISVGLHIHCTDADSKENTTLADLDDRLHYLVGKSPMAGEIWTSIGLGCSGLTLRSAWQFDRRRYGARQTSQPVLFVGNTADPVTPLANARAMARRFAGSRVLTQDGIGHCSISQFSFCTVRAIQAYFRTGELPAEGLVCGVDRSPFARPLAGASSAEADDDDDDDNDSNSLARAHAALGRAVHEQAGWAGVL